MNNYQEGFYSIRLGVLAINENHLEQISKILIQYYNLLKTKRPILFEEDQSEWQFEDIDKNITENDYPAFEEKMIEALTDMLGEVYSYVSSMITEIYGENDYPISKIEFYNKDGKTINDRIQRWWNPYSNQDLNLDFIQDKILGIKKLDAIIYAETLNETEIIKYDKLFHNCKYIEIMNEDDEADCDENIHCEVYWGKYSVENDDLPPLPLYHPDCECFAVYYPE